MEVCQCLKRQKSYAKNSFKRETTGGDRIRPSGHGVGMVMQRSSQVRVDGSAEHDLLEKPAESHSVRYWKVHLLLSMHPDLV